MSTAGRNHLNILSSAELQLWPKLTELQVVWPLLDCLHCYSCSHSFSALSVRLKVELYWSGFLFHVMFLRMAVSLIICLSAIQWQGLWFETHPGICPRCVWNLLNWGNLIFFNIHLTLIVFVLCRNKSKNFLEQESVFLYCVHDGKHLASWPIHSGQCYSFYGAYKRLAIQKACCCMNECDGEVGTACGLVVRGSGVISVDSRFESHLSWLKCYLCEC